MANALGMTVLPTNVRMRIGPVTHVEMTRCLRDKCSRRENSRTFEPAIIYGPLHSDTRASCISDRGKPAHEHVFGHLTGRSADVDRCVLVFQLIERRDQRHVSMRINETRR